MPFTFGKTGRRGGELFEGKTCGGKAQKEKMVNLYNLQKILKINRKFACGKSCGKCE